MTSESYRIEHGEFGKRMVLTGPWGPSLLGAAGREEISELELNYAHGWKGDDLEFLKDFPHLAAFEVVDWNIRDVTPIHSLSNLRRLKVSTYCKTEISFASFSRLEDVSLEWRSKAKSLFQCETLKRVFINKFAGADLSPLLALPQLTTLSVASPKISEIGAAPHVPPALDFLGICNARKLDSLEGVQQVPSVTRLEVNDCRKISKIDRLAELTSLRILHLCNCGELLSLRPLQELRGLRELLFYGTTSIRDGQVEFLLSLGLEKVVFQDRRHYDAKRFAFPTG